MKFRWTLLLLIGLCTVWFLVRLVRDEQILISDDAYPASPPIRVYLAARQDILELNTNGAALEVTMPMAEKPLIWDGKKSGYEYVVQRKQGRFIWGAGFADNVPWIELKPVSGRFSIEEGSYPGALRLYPQGDGSMVLVNHLPLELYVTRVIQGEARLSWSPETLKAQAVAARSYAFFHMQNRQDSLWDLTSGSRSQAYAGFDPGMKAHRATLDTLALVLVSDGKLFQTYYVNTCGGHTTRVELAFPGSTPLRALSGVECPFCRESPYFNWQVTLSPEETLALARLFNREIRKLTDCRVGAREHLRAKEISVNSEPVGPFRVSPLDFRRKVNVLRRREAVRSLNYEVVLEDGGLIISGNGWGYHGVGLCQYGASEMGRRKAFFTDILSYYYPDTSLRAAYKLQLDDPVTSVKP